MRVKRALKYLVLGITSLLLLGGCANEADALEKVVINDGQSLSNSVIAIMHHENLMEKYLPEGVEVEWTAIAAGTETRDGIIAGKIDIGTTALPIYIMGEDNDQPLVMFSAVGGTPVKLYTNDESRSRLDDFGSDDKIAVVGLGSVLHIAFLAQVYDQGLDVSQFDNVFSVMPHADGLAALAGGKDISGLLLSFPTTLKANDIESIHEVADFSDAVIKYGISTVSIMSEENYKKHPEIAEAFLRAQEDAIRLYHENPDYVAGFLSERWEIDPADIKEALDQVPLSMEIRGYNEQAQLLYQMGLIEKVPRKFEELDNYDKLMELKGK